MRVGRNNTLPSLNAVFSVGLQGLEEDLADAVTNQFGFENLNYGLGIELEVPIGNRAARGILQRAFNQRLQAITAMAGLREQAKLAIATAQSDVATSYAILARRQEAVQLRETFVDVIDAEEGLRPLTQEFISFKLSAIEDLSRARSQELQALTSYNEQIAILEREKGTLLRYMNVTVAEALPDAASR
jgi:hypothetical protein